MISTFSNNFISVITHTCSHCASFVVRLCLQYFPGRPVVMNLLHSLNYWLQEQSDYEISYAAIEQILDNTAQVSEWRTAWTFPINLSNFRTDLVHLQNSEVVLPHILHLGSTWMQNKRRAFVSLSKNASTRKHRKRRGRAYRAAVAGRTEGSPSQNAPRLMWGHLSGSSLVISLRYQDHSSE